MALKLLIASDNPEEARLIALAVRMRWIDSQVTLVEDGSRVPEEFEALQPDALLLALSESPVTIYELCSYVRKRSNAPVMVLTAPYATQERIRAVEHGADSCLSRPFDTLELVARLAAMIRRSGLEQQALHARARSLQTEQSKYLRAEEGTWPVPSVRGRVEVGPKKLASGGLVLDSASRQATLDGHVLRLTSTEYRLLEALVRQAGHILPHKLLLEQVWGPQYSSESQYLKVFVLRLRRKLGESSERPRFIQTEWGIGYRFIALQ